jgi:hypothetical protein
MTRRRFSAPLFAARAARRAPAAPATQASTPQENPQSCCGGRRRRYNVRPLTPAALLPYAVASPSLWRRKEQIMRKVLYYVTAFAIAVVLIGCSANCGH